MTDCACQNTYTRGVNFTAFILQLNKLKFIKKNFLVQSLIPGDLVELVVVLILQIDFLNLHFYFKYLKYSIKCQQRDCHSCCHHCGTCSPECGQSVCRVFSLNSSLCIFALHTVCIVLRFRILLLIFPGVPQAFPHPENWNRHAYLIFVDAILRGLF